MRITRLQLQDFRNYEQWVIEPDSSLTVLVGPNAVGKTNVIEAIQLVATGRSFRTTRWEEVVRWGQDVASIAFVAEGDGSHAEVRVAIERSGARKWTVGETVKRRTSDACRFVPVVIFTPDDLLLVKGPAEQRRFSLDAVGEQLSATFSALKRDYSRVIRQRNILLREGASRSAIEPWNQQLITFGARLHLHRRGLARRMATTASLTYSHIAGRESLNLAMTDHSGVGVDDLTTAVEGSVIEDSLAREIAQREPDERARGLSLVGPHRDDIVFTLNGKDARSCASQGQQRTITLSWKIAEVAVIREVLGKTPVLLLDDVMSELDQTRRGALTDLVQQDIQTFITATNTDYFDPHLLNQASLVTLNGGVV